MQEDKFKNYILRSFLWNSIYLGITLFAMFYLVNFAVIRNWNMFFVFFPLLIVAISSETGTRNKALKSYRVKPLPLIDFIAKLVAFALAQIAYTRLCVDALFYLLVVAVILIGILSYTLEFLMLKRLKRTQ